MCYHKSMFIHLSQGQSTVIDEKDYTELSKYKWFLTGHGKFRYAARCGRRPNGTRRQVRMHRQIMGLEEGDIREVDHINHDTLDNRKINLKIASHSENQLNQILSGCIWFHKQNKRWCVRITRHFARYNLGCFSTKEEAEKWLITKIKDFNH